MVPPAPLLHQGGPLQHTRHPDLPLESCLIQSSMTLQHLGHHAGPRPAANSSLIQRLPLIEQARHPANHRRRISAACRLCPHCLCPVPWTTLAMLLMLSSKRTATSKSSKRNASAKPSRRNEGWRTATSAETSLEALVTCLKGWKTQMPTGSRKSENTKSKSSSSPYPRSR